MVRVRFWLIVFVLGMTLAGLTPATAQGFNPFGENHTMTGAYRTPSSRSASLGTPQGLGAPLDEPATALQTPLSSDGGDRPSISGSTPAIVAFRSNYGAGNVVIDSGGRQLFLIVSATEAYRYPVAVGREGFAWTGVERVSRKAEWPEWRPPAEMRARVKNLPEVMSGGVRNPLGARAIYLGSTLYRIHGTNDSRSIGSASSSGCFRMTNANVVDLARRVSVGATVTVVNRLPASVLRAGIDGTAPAPAARKRS